MTDKQIIETIRNLKRNCQKYSCDCIGCQFDIPDRCDCLIKRLIRTLNDDSPSEWDMENIGGIVNETD